MNNERQWAWLMISFLNHEDSEVFFILIEGRKWVIILLLKIPVELWTQFWQHDRQRPNITIGTGISFKLSEYFFVSSQVSRNFRKSVEIVLDRNRHQDQCCRHFFGRLRKSEVLEPTPAPGVSHSGAIHLNLYFWALKSY